MAGLCTLDFLAGVEPIYGNFVIRVGKARTRLELRSEWFEGGICELRQIALLTGSASSLRPGIPLRTSTIVSFSWSLSGKGPQVNRAPTARSSKTDR
jgi:hypothetical protein